MRKEHSARKFSFGNFQSFVKKKIKEKKIDFVCYQVTLAARKHFPHTCPNLDACLSNKDNVDRKVSGDVTEKLLQSQHSSLHIPGEEHRLPSRTEPSLHALS